MDLTELFVPRKLPYGKPGSVALGKRHAELCQLVIQAILHHLVPRSELLVQQDSSSWQVLTRLILGITDNLLWRDGPNYLADELAEWLLTACFYLLLRSGIYADGLWKKFTECFRLWCHRVKTILVWGVVTLALTERVSHLLYSSAHGPVIVSFELHCGAFHVSMDNQFAIYAWHRLTGTLTPLLTFYIHPPR